MALTQILIHRYYLGAQDKDVGAVLQTDLTFRGLVSSVAKAKPGKGASAEKK